MNVPIEIFMLAASKLDAGGVDAWLKSMGVVGDGGLGDGTDAEKIVALAAKQCYMSFEPGLNPNVTKVRTDLVAYLDNILASGHGSVLEHVSFTFAINGVSRVFTGEMNRHRAGWAISERSGRFIRFGDGIPWWLPTSLQDAPDDSPEILEKKAKTRQLMGEAFSHQAAVYKELVNLWDMDTPGMSFGIKKRITSCLRRIIGMGYAGGGVWTGNIRALRHVITMRASEAAEEEIYHVFSRIAALMVSTEPMLFGDFECVNGYWSPRYTKV